MINLKPEKSVALMAVLLFLLLVMLFQGAVLIYINNQSRLAIKKVLSENAFYYSLGAFEDSKYKVLKEEYNGDDGYSSSYDADDIPGIPDGEDVSVNIDYECDGCDGLNLQRKEIYTVTVSTTTESKSGEIKTRRKIVGTVEKNWKLGISFNPDDAKWWFVYLYQGADVAWKEVPSG